MIHEYAANSSSFPPSNAAPYAIRDMLGDLYNDLGETMESDRESAVELVRAPRMIRVECPPGARFIVEWPSETGAPTDAR